MALSGRAWADRPKRVAIPAPTPDPTRGVHTVAAEPGGVYAPAVSLPPTPAGPGMKIASPVIAQPVRGAGTTLLVPANLRGPGYVRGGAPPPPIKLAAEPATRRRLLGRWIG